MSLSSFNLMRRSSDHYVLIKNHGSIILSFIHQQVGMETIANVLNTISLIAFKFAAIYYTQKTFIHRLIRCQQPLIFATDYKLLKIHLSVKSVFNRALRNHSKYLKEEHDVFIKFTVGTEFLQL